MTVLNITNLPPPRTELIDKRTGLMSREWYRFFENLFVLTGSGTNNATLVDMQTAPTTNLYVDMQQVSEQDALPTSVSSNLASDIFSIYQQVQDVQVSSVVGGYDELSKSIQSNQVLTWLSEI